MHRHQLLAPVAVATALLTALLLSPRPAHA